MKRLVFLTIICAAALSVMIVPDQGLADKPKGVVQGSGLLTSLDLDTTAAQIRDTLTQKFRFDEARNYSTISMIYRIGYYTVDTGDAAADIPDTAADTCIAEWYTSDERMRVSYLVHIDTLADFHSTDSAASDSDLDWTKVSFTSDTLLANIWARFIFIVQDSDYSVARQAGGIDYKIEQEYYAK